ncbi:MAG: HD domain-containing protein [Victivallaceae bacterium]
MADDSILSKIVLNNAQRERSILSEYACASIAGIRRHPEREKILDADNFRPVFFHDTDKIIHSKSYSRYIDKTQVFYLFDNDHIAHRVLHVQMVSKIGRVIGRALRLNEDLIEAIALGHDLGHVPFGHDGERIMNKICEGHGIGYFRHNAQSVRCLDLLESKGRGCNLSLQTLDGILCHNGEMASNSYYPSPVKDWIKFDAAMETWFSSSTADRASAPFTLEGCVVRVSDIISYIGRDIEDAITLNVIKRSGLPPQAAEVLGDNNAKIVNVLTLDLIENSYDKPFLSFSPKVYEALMALKQFNVKHIYENNLAKKETHKIDRMFNMLFDYYLNDLITGNENSSIFKGFLNNLGDAYLHNVPDARKVVDFIAGMTDNFFNRQFELAFVPQKLGYRLCE